MPLFLHLDGFNVLPANLAGSTFCVRSAKMHYMFFYVLVLAFWSNSEHCKRFKVMQFCVMRLYNAIAYFFTRNAVFDLLNNTFLRGQTRWKNSY